MACPRVTDCFALPSTRASSAATKGATLADIARRAEVSTPAVYGHFSGKAALLVEASKRELDAISTTRLAGEAGIREIARRGRGPTLLARGSCSLSGTAPRSANPRRPNSSPLWQHEKSLTCGNAPPHVSLRSHVPTGPSSASRRSSGERMVSPRTRSDERSMSSSTDGFRCVRLATGRLLICPSDH